MKAFIYLLVWSLSFFVLALGGILLRIAGSTPEYAQHGFVAKIYGLVICCIGLAICIAKVSYEAGRSYEKKKANTGPDCLVGKSDR